MMGLFVRHNNKQERLRSKRSAIGPDQPSQIYTEARIQRHRRRKLGAVLTESETSQHY